MAEIILNKTGSYTGFQVDKQIYIYSDLFDKYQHSPKNLIFGGNIYICKENTRKKITLNIDKYKKSRLRTAYVYFNKSDKYNNNPLALVLFFNNQRFRYCKYSRLGPLIDGNKSMDIESFDEYNDNDTDRQIFDKLISENDISYKCITYQIDKTKSYYNEKIELKDETESIELLQRNGFKQYSHKHKDGTKIKSYFLCNMYLLLGSNDESIIIQGKEFTGMYVYTSSKVETPLLIEVFIDENETTNKFYYPKKGGFTSISCEEITKDSDVSGIKFGANEDIQKELYDNNHVKLVKLLLKLESRLMKTILIILDDQTTSYLYSNKSKDFANKNNYDFANEHNIVVVRDRIDSHESCIKKHGFKVYEHDITTTLNGFSPDQEFQFKFITGNGKKDGDKYNELKIFDSVDQENETTILYRKPVNKLYVYFFGNDDHPLLFSYNNQTFRAKSAEEYKEYKWRKLKDITNLECTFFKSNPIQILKLLNEVREFLEIKIVPEEEDSYYSSIQYKNHNSGAIFGAIGATGCILGFVGFFAYKNNERIQRLIRRYWR